MNNFVVLRCVTDGSEHGDIYGLAGKSPAAHFSYPAFTFPGPQVRIKKYWVVFGTGDGGRARE